MDTINLFDDIESNNDKTLWCPKICYNNEILDDTTSIINVYSSLFINGLCFFEDIICKANTPYAWLEHYNNILRSINALQFNTEDFPSSDIMLRRLEIFISKNHYPAFSLIRLMVWQSTVNPQKIEWVFLQKKLPSNPYDFNPNGIIIDTFEDAILPQLLCNWVKMISPVRALAEKWAKQHNYAAAGLINTERRIIGTTLGNLYIIKGNNIIGVNPSYGTYYNTLETIVKAIAPRLGFDMKYAEGLTSQAIQAADEIMIISEITGIHCVIGYGSTRYYKKSTSKIAQEVANYFK